MRVGIGGFLLDVRVKESVEFKSDVPDSYVEDGSVIQDNVINNPIVLQIEGEVSDIHIKAEFKSDYIVKYVDKAEGILDNLFPFSLTQQAMQKIKKLAISATDMYMQLDSYAKRTQNLYNLFNKSNPKSIQEEFLKFIKYLYTSKNLITIETRSGVYKNMRIVSIVIETDNTTNGALSYKLTAKEVRFAKTYYVKGENLELFYNTIQEATATTQQALTKPQNPALSVADKVATKTNKGIVQGEKKSFLYTLFN